MFPSEHMTVYRGEVHEERRRPNVKDPLTFDV